MAQIREPPRTEVIDAVINLFSRYTGSSNSTDDNNSVPKLSTLSSPKSSTVSLSRSVASSTVTTTSTTTAGAPMHHPLTGPETVPVQNPPSPRSASLILRLRSELESKEEYIHQLHNENHRLTSLLNTTSAKLEDTISILSQKAHGWLDLEKSMERQKEEYQFLQTQYDKEVTKNTSLQLTLDDLLKKLQNQEEEYQRQLRQISVVKTVSTSSTSSLLTGPSLLPTSPPKPETQIMASPTVSLASYKSLETELKTIRSAYETEKTGHHDYRSRYEQLLKKYQQEMNQYQQEIETLQQQSRYGTQKNTALIEQLRKDNEYLSKLASIDHYTNDSHYLRSPNDITPQSYLDPQVWQQYQSHNDPVSVTVQPMGNTPQHTVGEEEEDIEKLQPPTVWPDAPTWVPTEAVNAAHELYLSLPAASSVQDSYSLQKFLLQTNQAYYDKLLTILKKQEKIFKKKLAWRVPFQEVLQASTITRLRSTVTTLQSLVQGRNPPPAAALGVTTVDRDNATPGELAFGRHDTYNQHSLLSLNSLQNAKSRSPNSLNGGRQRSLSPSKARLLSVPGSGGKRLDGYESAQLLVQAMECVEFLQNKIQQLENDATVSRNSSPLARSRGVSPAPFTKHPDTSATSPPVPSSQHFSPGTGHLRTFRTSSPSLLSPGPTDTVRTLPVDGTLRHSPQRSNHFASPNLDTAVTRKSPSTPPFEVRDAIMASQSPLQYTAGLSNRRSHPGTW